MPEYRNGVPISGPIPGITTPKAKTKKAKTTKPKRPKNPTDVMPWLDGNKSDKNRAGAKARNVGRDIARSVTTRAAGNRATNVAASINASAENSRGLRPPTSSSGSGRGGSGGGGGGGGSAPVGRPAGGSQGERKRTREAGAAGRAQGAAAADEALGTSSLFDSARRSLQAERDRQAALREARLRDLEKFDAYIQQARQQANSTLQQQFAASAQQAQTSRDQFANRAAELAQQASAQVGGTAIQNAAGIGATNQAYGFRAQADGVSTASNAFNSANLMQRNTERQNEDFARSAALRGELDLRYNKTLADLDRQGRDLELQEIKATIEQKNADRQYELDRQAAEFLQSYRQGQLGVEQFNAETRRIEITNAATLQQAKLQLEQQVAAGNLTAKQANLELRRAIAQSDLTEKQKDRAMKLRIAKIRAGGAAGNPNKDATTFLGNWVKNRLASQGNGATWDQTGDPFKASTVRGSIAALKLQYPGMTQSQAAAALTSHFGARLMQSNPAYAQLVAQTFKRG